MLQQRIDNVERSFASFESHVDGRFETVLSQIAVLSPKFDDRNRPQWSILISAGSLILAFCVTIGGLAYMPIKAGQEKVEAEVQRLRDAQVPRSEQAERRAIDVERMCHNETAIAELERRIVPHGEHEEKWRSQQERDSNIQRQVASLRKDLGNLYSPKDAIASMQRRSEGREAGRGLEGLSLEATSQRRPKVDPSLPISPPRLLLIRAPPRSLTRPPLAPGAIWTDGWRPVRPAGGAAMRAGGGAARRVEGG